MAPLATTTLLHELQMAAIKDVYTESIDTRSFATKYPSLSHTKQPILSVARALRKGLGEKALHARCARP